MVVWCKWCGKQIGNSVFTAQELKEDWKLTCPECKKFGFIAHDPHRKYLEHKDGFPHIDWNETFEKLRELANKADSLASKIEETAEYMATEFYHGSPVSYKTHRLAESIFNYVLEVMSESAELAEEVATLADKEKEEEG